MLGGACFGLPTTMVSERERGVWRRYRLTPVPIWAFIVSTLAARYVLLLSAAPVADPHVKRERIVLQGDVPSPIDPPSGCAFHTRCPHAFERCRAERPALKAAADGRQVACHLVA